MSDIDTIQDLVNETSFITNALVAFIESPNQIDESTFVGILNGVRELNRKHNELLQQMGRAGKKLN